MSMTRLCCALIILWLYSISPLALAEIASDQIVIADIVRSVDMERLEGYVADLQENRDVDDPGTSYNSRYCLRVRDSSNPSDGACDNAAEYIYNTFASYGLDVEYDPFIHEVEEKGSFKMRNVVATLPGKGPHSDKVYIICSHYDSTAGLSAGWMWDWKILPAPGADDNASGTAAVLEAARILSGYDFNFTIKFIAFSGEELGMFGSKHYARDARTLGHQIAGVINLDMIAYDPDEFDVDIVTDEDSQWLANALINTGKLYDINLVVNMIVDPQMYYSDHWPFWKSGYNAVLVIEGSDRHSQEFSPVNHTADDTIEKLDFRLALKTTRLAVATLAQLADPITGPEDSVYPDLAVEEGSIRFSHIPSGRGDTITVTARIHNLGPGDVEDASVEMLLSIPSALTKANTRYETLAEWNLDLDGNASRQVSALLTLEEWGDYQILVRANPDSRTPESNFTNNVARETVFISTKLGIDDLVIYPNPALLSEGEEVSFRYKLSQDANVTMSIYDIQGRLLYSADFGQGENGGQRGPNNNVKWNGANHHLNPVAPGIYICCFAATNENGETDSVCRKLALLR